jgi:hypothetical protein
MPWPPLLNSASSVPPVDLHGLAPSLFDARRIAVVDPNAVEPFGLPRGHVLGLATGGDDPPAPIAQRMRSREADTG